LYIYNKDKSILLYQSPSKIVFKTDTGISHEVINNYLNEKLYLDSFYISDELLLDVVKNYSGLNPKPIREIIELQRGHVPYY
jgi:hypothetical protein